MDIKRFGTTEVEGIDVGTCYIFPKIDGTNASLWSGKNFAIQGGSRRRHLSESSDNAGFLNWATEQHIDNLKFQNFIDLPHLRLYGEWLVPHSLKTYRDNAWRDFYVFDVYDENEGKYLSYDEYKPIMEEYDINYIPPLGIIDNPTYESLVQSLDKNQYLIEDGKGNGEGIVIKNYDFINKYGREIWGDKVGEPCWKVLQSSQKGPCKFCTNDITKFTLSISLISYSIAIEFNLALSFQCFSILSVFQLPARRSEVSATSGTL